MVRHWILLWLGVAYLSEEEEILEFFNDSWISHVKYNTRTGEMVVTAHGKDYALQSVPQDVYDEFLKAPSKGQFFNANLRGNYSHKWFA